MGLLKKMLECFGFEDKPLELIQTQPEPETEEHVVLLMPLAERVYHLLPSQALKALNELMEQPENKFRDRTIGELKWDLKQIVVDRQMKDCLDYPEQANSIEAEDIDEAIQICQDRWKKERWGE